MRGAYFRMTLNLNTQCKSTHNIVASQYTFISVQSPNGVLPFMLSPIGTGFETGTCSSVEASLAIGKSLNGAFSHPTMNQVR